VVDVDVHHKLHHNRRHFKDSLLLSHPQVPVQPGVVWSTDASKFVPTHFNPKQTVGPRNIPDTITADSSPEEYLSLLWDDSLWNLLVEETNRQAEYVKASKPNNYFAKTFVPVTIEEMKAFFGCRVAMELLLHKDRYEQYWRSKSSWLTVTPGFPKVFTRDRFLAIWSFLHCVDENGNDLDKSDKIYKTRPVLQKVLQNFYHYYVPQCELSLDEGMIPTKNKLGFKQYIKDKPIKWGIKTFILCESSSGYIVNAEVYTGKVDDDPSYIRNLGVTGSLVVRLCKPFEGQYHCVFTDRFYTSVTLAEYLLDNHATVMVGTALTNRKLFPASLVKKKMDRGTSEMLFNGKVATVVWCDKKPIYFVATKYVSDDLQSVLRYNPQEHKRVPVPCPSVVKAYNEFMGGTDKNDQLTKLHRCRRHYKWPRRLVVKFFVWSLYNAYVLQNHYHPHRQPGKRDVTFHAFVSDVCHALVGAFRRAQEPMSRQSSQIDEARLVNAGSVPQHLPERPANATTNNRCVVCSQKYNQARRTSAGAKNSDWPKRTKTVYWCKSCQVFLCIGTGTDNCFEAYHTKVQFWR